MAFGAFGAYSFGPLYQEMVGPARPGDGRARQVLTEASQMGSLDGTSR
jgi:hypothetical protein